MNASVIFVRDALDFRVSRDARRVSTPVSIREWLDAEGIDEFDWPTLCLHNGESRGRSLWATTEIRDGDVVHFVSLPAGGGGQNGGKNPFAMAFGIGLLLMGGALASGVGPFAGLSSGQVMAGMAGLAAAGYLVNQIFPPSGPKQPKQPSPTYSLSPEGNRARIGDTIPVAYGRMMVVPDYAEQPWTTYEGYGVDVSAGTSDPSRQAEEQYLYQLFCLTCGYIDKDDIEVYVGNTSIRGFGDDIEWAVYDPDEEIQLIRRRVITSEDVRNQELKGPNHKDFKPATPGARPRGGQIMPYEAGTGVAGGSEWYEKYYTADDGMQTTTTVVDGITVTVGTLVDNDIDFLNDPDLILADLIGKQVWIGGAQGADGYSDSREFYPYYSGESWSNAANGLQHYKLVHPDRLRTIVKVEQNTLYVRPAWHATYGPHNAGLAEARQYHIRDDFIGPFALNPPGTTLDKIGLDISVGPAVDIASSGDRYRLAIGLRFEIRLINDAGFAMAGPYGEWRKLGPEYTQLIRYPDDSPSGFGDLWGTVYKSDMIGSLRWVEYSSELRDKFLERSRGAYPGRRATWAIWGSAAGVEPTGHSLVWVLKDLGDYPGDYGLPPGRYEIRGRRTSYQKTTSQYGHKVFWTGAKGYISNAAHKYPGVTTLAVKSRASGDLQALTSRQIRAVIKRKIPQYGIARAASALANNPIAIESGSQIATITRANHQLVPAQTVVLAGVTGTPGGIANATWNDAGGYAIVEVVDVDRFTIDVAAEADTGTTGAGGSGVTVTATAGWYGPSYTANPAWVLADACRDTDYGLGLADAKIDVDALRALADVCDTRGLTADKRDEFGGVFDAAQIALDALNAIGRTCRARIIQPAGVITPVRDEPKAIRAAAFSERNIVRDSFSIGYAFPRDDSVDQVQVEYFDRSIWKPKLVPLTTELPAGSKPAIIKLFGITDREHAWREAMYERAQMRYRRRTVRFATDYEGHIPTILDKISVTHSMPDWGTSGDLTGYAEGGGGTYVLTLSEAVEFDALGGDLVDNWNFEESLDDWAASGTQITLTRSAEEASHGAYCARMRKNSGGNEVLTVANDTYVSDLTNGTNYTITADLRAGYVGTDGKTAHVMLRLTGGAQGTVDRISNSITLSFFEWRTATLTTTIDQPDRTLATIMVGIIGTGGNGDANANDVVYVDNVHAYKSGASVQHYVALQKDDGSLDGPHLATAVGGQPYQVTIAGALVFTPETVGTDRDRTRFKFGRADKWHKDVLVTAIIPRGGGRVELECVNEDDRVHEADGATYVPPTDEEILSSVPESPVVTWVSAVVGGPLSDRRVLVTWAVAPGAQFYVVEQTADDVSKRHVAIDGAYIWFGPLDAGETIAAFTNRTTLPASSTIGTTNGQARVDVYSPAHGLQTNNWIFLSGLPSIGVIPWTETNGVHQVTVTDADNYNFVTATTAATDMVKPTGNRTWYMRRDTTARGRILSETATGTDVLQYEYTSGLEIQYGETVAGLTSRAWFVTLETAGIKASWTRVGTGTTVKTYISGDVIVNDVYPTVDTITVRVRGVGRLLGPWAYATALVEDVPAITGARFAMTGQAVVATTNYGMLLRTSVWVVADGTAPLTGTIVAAPEHHRIKAVEVEVVQAFDGTVATHNLLVGHESDDDAYMTSAFWAASDTLAVVGLHTLNLMSVEGGQPGIGTALGKYSSAARTVAWKLTAVTTAPTQGKAIVTVVYESVEPDPTL